jgi:hypothetical protein
LPWAIGLAGWGSIGKRSAVLSAIRYRQPELSQIETIHGALVREPFDRFRHLSENLRFKDRRQPLQIAIGTSAIPVGIVPDVKV